MSSLKAQRERAAAINRWVRFGIQVVFFVLAPAFFAAAFNGVKHLFQQMGLSAPLEMGSFLAMLVAVLAFTVIFGRFFCGYACAFGTLGDVLFGAFDFLRSKTPLPPLTLPDKLVRALSLLKYAVLLAICALCFSGAWSAVSGFSPWVSFAGIISGSVEGIAAGAFVTLGLVLVLMIVRERAFCQFLCPLGALFALMPVLGFSKYTRDARRCPSACGRCKKGCPVDIWPDGELAQGECISCGKCADACPIENVNMLAVREGVAEEKAMEAASRSRGASVRQPRSSTRLVRGTEAAVVLGKAVLLLALFWLLGAVRYLPLPPFGS